MGEIFIDETGARRSNMMDKNTFIRIQNKVPVVGDVGHIVRGDTNSNIITFEMERYHDGEDLKDKDIRIIVKNELGVYAEDAYDIRYSNLHIRFSWLLSSADTLNGDVEVTVEVYGNSSIGRTYSLNSIPFKLKIEDSLRATDTPVVVPDNWFTITDTRISALENDVENIQDNIDLSAYQTKVDLTLNTTAKQVNLAINELNGKIHDHTNKDILDKLDMSNAGELLFNGNKINSVDEISIDNRIDEKVPIKITEKEKTDYDDAVTKKHEHSNKQVIDNFTTNAQGELLYNNKKISSDWTGITDKPFELVDEQDFNINADNTLSVANVVKQKTSMPIASLDEFNSIYQYTGKTTADLVNGFFYKCIAVYDDQNVLTGYEWKPLTVQPDDGSSKYVTKTELETHAKSNTHITQGERNSWNNKANPDDIPTKVSDLVDDVNLSQIHTHSNQTDVLDRLGVNDNNKLTYNGVLVAADMPLSSDEDNIIVSKADGFYVPKTDLSEYSKTTEIITSSPTRTEDAVDEAINNSHTHNNKDSVLDKLDVNNSNQLLFNGVMVASGTPISSDTDNSIINKSDGLYVAKPDLSNYAKKTEIITSTSTRSEGAIDTAISNSHTHGNKATVLDKLNVNDNNKLTYDGKVIEANVELSSDSDNDLTLGSDNKLYHKPNHTHTNKTVLDKISENGGILTYDGIAIKSSVDISSESDNILVKKDDGLYVPAQSGSSGSVTVSPDSNNIIQNKANGLFAENKVESVNGISPVTDSKDIILTLDNIADGTNRKLGSATVSISSENDNIIENKSDGLYATVDLSSYETTEHAQDTYATQTALQGVQEQMSGYLNEDDAKAMYMAKSDYIDPTTNEINGSTIKKQSVKYSDLDEVGQLDGLTLEQKLLNHLKNTQIHNLGNLSSVLINTSEWNNGLLTNFVVTDSGTMQLTPSSTTDNAYTTDKAEFVSMVYDIGEVLPFQLVTFDAVYNPYIVNIKFYVRTGTTPAYSGSTWTAWQDITSSMSLTGVSSQYIQIKIEAQTANEYKNIEFNYIQIFYGQDTESEVIDARKSSTNTYPSLKQRLDNMDNEINTVFTVVDQYSKLDETDVNDIVADLQAIIAIN